MINETPCELLKKACEIIELAEEDYHKFSNIYCDCMVSIGERGSDGATFSINLSNDHLFYIETSDYSVIDFEIRSKQIAKRLTEDELFRVWYPPVL